MIEPFSEISRFGTSIERMIAKKKKQQTSRRNMLSACGQSISINTSRRNTIYTNLTALLFHSQRPPLRLAFIAFFMEFVNFFFYSPVFALISSFLITFFLCLSFEIFHFFVFEFFFCHIFSILSLNWSISLFDRCKKWSNFVWWFVALFNPPHALENFGTRPCD